MPLSIRSSASRHWLVWLLVLLVPLQALAGGVVAATGSAHTHLTTAPARIVLDDLRRAPVRRVGSETHAAGKLGHFHGSGAIERHHHVAGDPTVLPDSADPLHAGGADDPSVSPSLGVFAALISTPPGWPDASTPPFPASHARWTPQTHHPAVPERPPRAA